jgi:hypothetical protein
MGGFDDFIKILNIQIFVKKLIQNNIIIFINSKSLLNKNIIFIFYKKKFKFF